MRQTQASASGVTLGLLRLMAPVGRRFNEEKDWSNGDSRGSLRTQGGKALGGGRGCRRVFFPINYIDELESSGFLKRPRLLSPVETL